MKLLRVKERVVSLLKQGTETIRKVQPKDLTAELRKRFLNQQKIKKAFSTPQWGAYLTASTDWIRRHQRQVTLAALSVGLIAGASVAAKTYVAANTHTIVHVYYGDQQLGSVTSTKVVEQFVNAKVKQTELSNPEVHMKLNADAIAYVSEEQYQAKANNKAVLAKLDDLLVPQAVGVQLVVDGKAVAVVKDKETAEEILNVMKSKYAPGAVKVKRAEVTALSVQPVSARTQSASKKKYESVEFVQKVQTVEVNTDAKSIMSPDEVLKMLETGNVQPTKYVVKEGDCVGCIATKFNISVDTIYKNNPWIVDDMIRVGDTLDLTVLQPTLGVKTTEKMTEQHTIEPAVEYQNDSSLRKGQTKTIREGKSGKKQVTFLLTKVNGETTNEQLVDEKVLVQPVAALVKRGTRVVLGEGSGKFANPVSGGKLSSKFGKRWGRQHKGIDLVSSNKTIMASDNGKVEFAGTKSGYGKVVIINHRNGYKTLYAHLSKITVKKGAVVEKGQKIGVMGNTGRSTGVHLHFEVLKSGVSQNPLRYL